jgi:hypothetical protein
LQSRRDALEKQLQHLQSEDAPFHILSMFDHQIAMMEAEMSWFDGWIDEWEAHAPDEEADPLPVDSLPVDAPPMQRVVMPDDPMSFHKHETRKHQESDFELPPTPERRSPETDSSHSDATRFNSPTPPQIRREDE